MKVTQRTRPGTQQKPQVQEASTATSRLTEEAFGMQAAPVMCQRMHTPWSTSAFAWRLIRLAMRSTLTVYSTAVRGIGGVHNGNAACQKGALIV